MKEIIRKIRELLYDILPHSLLTKIYFRISLKRNLNLKNPISFNEKICWYKLNYCPNNELIIQCADKLGMRDYMQTKGLIQYLVPLIGEWKNANDINWNELPNEFVLKTNHGCHFNFICKDKANHDEHKTKKMLNKWLSINYGKLNVEPHYNKIKPLIVGEKYIGDIDKGIIDYKLHCFHSEPKYFEISSERVENGDALYSSYDINWNNLHLFKYDVSEIEKPACIEEMLKVSKEISKDFPYVRIDFYIVNNKPLIGELTFSPAGGMDRDLTFEADNKIGQLLDINSLI